MSVGVKETRELLVGLNEVSLLLLRHLKDGVVGEFEAFYQAMSSNADFKTKVQAAFDNYQAVPEEVKDLNIAEVVELSMVQLNYVPQFASLLV